MARRVCEITQNEHLDTKKTSLTQKKFSCAREVLIYLKKKINYQPGF